MAPPLRRLLRKVFLASIFFVSVTGAAGPAGAETGYDLWLRYVPVKDAARRAAYQRAAAAVVVQGTSPTAQAVRAELVKGLTGLLGAPVLSRDAVQADGALVAGTPATSPLVAGLGWSKPLAEAGREGFLIRSTRIRGRPATVIASEGEAGMLYGAFHFLRLIQTSQDVARLDVVQRPRIELRMLDHWDNLDGTIERGYAGPSLWKWAELPGRIDPRVEDYARANASLGINGTVLNSVNANPESLSAAYLEKAAALARALRPYGIRVYLSANFAAPKLLGRLATADPLDPAVARWWKDKADEIYRLIPDFGGFLVKANSEGQPGPQDYHRTHADGANVLADAVRPHGGVVMWRAFVYDASVDPDRVKRAYLEFVPLDGRFRDNVFVQVKNGPLDFQPREPFHPMFGAMPGTPLMAELQITQEYLGQSNHLVYLAPMWKEFLDADTYARGAGTPVARIVDGTVEGHRRTGIAGVANTGSDANWCGHDFAQANWYAFGRLAWDPGLGAETIAEEWIRMTWGSTPDVVATIRGMMLGSRETFVSYTMPLGLHHLIGGNHYAPMPENTDPRRADWSATYYHHADASGIGFDRTSHGSNAVGQYRSPLREEWADPLRCPENLLLWFHRLPWDHPLASGGTLWEGLVRHYRRGAREARALGERWASLRGQVDDERFAAVSAKLERQSADAAAWSEKCLRYFQGFSGRPLEALTIADGDGPPLKTLMPRGVRIGAALNQAQVEGAEAAAAAIVTRHFDSISPENLLKWALVHPEPDRYDFPPADRYVAFGEAHGMTVIGHNLVWHRQTPDWVFAGADGGPADRETLLARLRAHIEAVVGRYRGRIHGWDVVNEALAEDGTLRPTRWLQAIGPDYIAKAFEYAHAADPGAELYYNDYDLWKPAKREAALRIVGDIRARGLRVDAVGEQAHWRLDRPTLAEMEATVAAITGAGFKAMFTEMDIDVLPRSPENPYADGLPDEAQRQLAARYAEIFAFVRTHPDQLTRVTFWGVTDARSWLNNYPIRGRTNHPLLWDRQGRPKPAFAAVVAALRPGP